MNRGGTGKTIVALKIIEKIKNVFHCKSEDILYVCENQPLSEFVRKKNICQSVTFLNGKYCKPVKHLVIDEAQNFQSKDGDCTGWLSRSQKEMIICEPGVLWIFLDYLQTSHTFPGGLPHPSEQYPQEWLTKRVRNATRI
ncbi:E3 ubiquitin-protein ligase E3D [Platysternon megacephalum]|uniref:E3 ubiquitin-protein ligase E3D n=1 Tax=Platysternon megacephalum TaxID=55544 RepID=A0A4D9ER34_9SAUR|nr:E3 ubiquitin-protein ligase E3D [Platysternon megacephalum]